MECYFREHMAERDLVFIDDLAEPLAARIPVIPKKGNWNFSMRFTAPKTPLRRKSATACASPMTAPTY